MADPARKSTPTDREQAPARTALPAPSRAALRTGAAAGGGSSLPHPSPAQIEGPGEAVSFPHPGLIIPGAAAGLETAALEGSAVALVQDLRAPCAATAEPTCPHCEGYDCDHHCHRCGAALERVETESSGSEPGDCWIESFDVCPRCQPDYFEPEREPAEPIPNHLIPY